uniref:Uncharacterized protein n=1 Tax=Anguilla anguilla TaxID=7936 RepID=A0A0E9P7X7_ANGAN
MELVLLSFNHEDEGVVGVEQLGVLQLVRAEDAGVERVSLGVPLQGRGVEDVGQVKVLT